MKTNLMMIWGIKTGIKAYNEGKSEIALKNYFKSLKIAQGLKIKPFIAVLSYNIGLIYDSWGDYEDSMFYYEKSLKIWKELDFEPGITKVAGKIEAIKNIDRELVEKILETHPPEPQERKIHKETEKIIEAPELKEKKIDKNKPKQEKMSREVILRAELLDKLTKADEIIKIAQNYHIKGKNQIAMISYRKALEIYEETNHIPGKAMALTSIAAVYRSMGNYPDAINMYQHALKLNRDLNKEGNKDQTIGIIFNNIGTTYLAWGRDREAFNYLNKALEIYKKIDYERGISVVQNNLRRIEQTKPMIIRTQERPSISVAGIKKQIGLKRKKAKKLREFAKENQINGNFHTALDYFNKARDILLEIGQINDRNEISEILINIAALYRSQKNYEESLRHYKKSLEIKERINDREGKAKVLTFMGFVYRDIRNINEAIRTFYEALKIYEDLDDTRGINMIMNNLNRII
ncbi:MAG: tetratricopeptide repeat protein [Promethearchaeota archaeon]|nr:MAG: tetratricopeptide repeat protein [Candidatus Lokiarchaeota archaeon]